jgi:hypothetical protein
MSDPKYHVLENFLNIYGVRINQAWKWVQQGQTGLKDLQVHVPLTKNQPAPGIEHYDDFLTQTPVDEVASLGNVVKAAAASIDPKVEVIVGGGYRFPRYLCSGSSSGGHSPRTRRSSRSFVQAVTGKVLPNISSTRKTWAFQSTMSSWLVHGAST